MKEDKEKKKREKSEIVWMRTSARDTCVTGQMTDRTPVAFYIFTPITAFNSVMVTCLARSTAVATCCWCCSVTHVATTQRTNWQIKIAKKKLTLVTWLDSTLITTSPPGGTRFQSNRNTSKVHYSNKKKQKIQKLEQSFHLKKKKNF